MKVILPEHYMAMPWKNGLGVTTELFRNECENELKFRISTAKVESSGPFSIFPGLERTLVNCGPGSMKLTIDGETKATIIPWDQIEFKGDSKTSCEVDMPLTDLNIFCKKGYFTSTCQVLCLESSGNVQMSVEFDALIYAVNGGLSVFSKELTKIFEVPEKATLLRVNEKPNLKDDWIVRSTSGGKNRFIIVKWRRSL